MSDEIVISNCSPTLASLKTANLFGCRFSGRDELLSCMKRYNAKLVPKGLRMIPLKFENGRALIYIYRPDRLKRDLNDKCAERILSERNYPVKNMELCIATLRKRLSGSSLFPHEIGLFLGYPPKDVDGFIKHGGKGEKCTGTWKVYGDKNEAENSFRKYKKCTQAYMTAFRHHHSFERLVVGKNK